MSRLLVGIVGDVHYPDASRFYMLLKLLESVKPDVLVVAGDLVSYPSRDYISRLFSKLRRHYHGPIVAVAGNHEHWLTRSEMRERMTSIEKLQLLAELYAKRDAILLDVDGPLCLDEVCFAGVTGWYDYSYAAHLGFTRRDFENCNPWGCTLAELEACEKGATCTCPDWFRDCLHVKLDTTAPEYAEHNAKRLREQLAKTSAKRETIVVLHHAPRRDLIRYTGDKHQDFYLAYAGHEKLDTVIREYAHKVKHVVYGHLHEKSIEFVLERHNIVYTNAYRYITIFG